MAPRYMYEREGQVDFYNRFLPRINPELSIEDILSDYSDGVLNGNLIEFKLNISNLNEHLSQCIKYLSAMRLKGKPVPANILIIGLNSGDAFYYQASEYLSEIEAVYYGGSSKNNKKFIGKNPSRVLHYEEDPLDAENLISLLKQKKYTKIHIDENCIVGWAEFYYNLCPTARKEDFLGDDTGKHKTIGEIRKPRVFSEFIYPYSGSTNIKFNYLMDKLNDTLQKKNLGAFYTPPVYAQKSLELLRIAISRIPAENNDYIILDRCAGTGNLESYMTDEELSHCIVSTVEYYEYKVLMELIGSKVRALIPPVETTDTFNAGLVTGADALSREYIENSIIMEYVNNPKCTIILFENPPYAETTSAEHQRKGHSKQSSTWKGSYAVTEMKKELKGTATNDLGNVFIWSGFHYYLRQPSDSYIVYSPVKYWKVQHMINKKLISGFAFNRRWFHTNTDACIMVALWANEEDINTDAFQITGYDCNGKTNELVEIGLLDVKRIHSSVSSVYYDKRVIQQEYRKGILCGLDGLEKIGGVKRNKPASSPDIIGYMVAHSSGFDNPDLDSSLLVGGRYDGNGFYLHKDNYLEKLPLFCMSRYITYNHGWTERARIMKSADGAARFLRDVSTGKLEQFLLKCLLFTCLEMQNHMRTFWGSDGRFYRNELCLDDTNGPTIASKDIINLKMNSDEKQLISLFKELMENVKKTSEYDAQSTYGVYQIFKEIDTSYVDDVTGKTIWNNEIVHSDLQTLKTMVKSYYNKEIVPVLFEYEFLK